MAKVSLAHSYPELFRVTGPLPSLVLRAEDMWQRYNQFLEVGGALNQGFPFSPLMSHFRGLREGLEYQFLDCIQDLHQVRNRNGALGWSGFPLLTPTMQAGQDSDGGGGWQCVRCMQW
jgi:hypothetical protein